MPGSSAAQHFGSNAIRSGLLLQFDTCSEWIIYFMVVFSPWAFGTTQSWSISVMNTAGFALGILWLVKCLVRSRQEGTDRKLRPAPRWFVFCLGTLTFLVLSYVLVSALNARATYFPTEWRFEYRTYISWLPHSYNVERSWDWFWIYLSLGSAFWGIRDWITHDIEKASGATPRWQRLLWVVCINGTVVAFQGLLQRAEGSPKLLWIVEPRVNKSPDTFFGPYAYRANAAQFLNLVWPVTLGLWCALSKPGRKEQNKRHPGLRHLLLPCAALTAIAPVVSASRGGALVTGMGVLISCIILFAFQKRSGRWRLGIVPVGIITIIAGWVLGWEALGKRMTELDAGFEQRESMYATARQIAEDYPLFGTGAGSFDALFQLYRSSSDEYWPAQLHNDWLETLMTFGWLGSSLIWGALLLACVRPFLGGNAIRVEGSVVGFLWLALGGCLVHARYDFPFQIYSILFLFVLISAVLASVTLSRKQKSIGASS